MDSIFREVNEEIITIRDKNIPPYTSYKVHYHDCYEIILFLSGNLSYFIKDKIYPIQKHDLIFIPPFSIHRVNNITGKHYERIVINFKEEVFNNAFTDSKILDFFTSSINKISVTNNDIVNIFNSLCYEKKVNDTYSGRRVRLLLEELLIILNREIKYTKFKPENNTKNDKVLSIISYINENYMNEITLSLLADKFYLSQSYLVHLFKDVTGFTIMEYLNKKRISMAQQMLFTGNHSISSTGELVGYNNLTSFSRTFKEITGLSPMQYKKQRKF